MLRDRKNRIRLVLFILAVLIAVGSFTTWAIKLGHRESGYQTIVYENTHADVLYRTGISMIYWAEGNAADIRTLSNTVQRIYSDSLYRNFIQLDSAEVYAETENIAALNRHPGEEIRIPDRLAGVLRDALEKTGADEGYSAFAGALYDEWERLLYLDEPQNADPANSPEEAERIARIAGAVRPENGIRLTLSEGEGGTTACLTVPEEYRRLAEELEISAPILDLNLLHDDWRYACCYIHDWWAMKYGRDFIGRMWRETRQYEDPVQTYIRMNKLTQAQFCDELMEGYMRMATWDIDGVRERAKHRIGQHKNRLRVADAQQNIYTTSPATCIQNYGYHITNMRRPAAGTTVRAHFTGLTDAEGYHYVYPARAGWRYAFVAMTSDGTRLYGDVKADREGTAELTVPEGCTRLFFVVMGAPTQHWPHPWTSGKASSDWAQNEEQWPYQVRFEETKPL